MKISKLTFALLSIFAFTTANAGNYTVKVPLDGVALNFDTGTPTGEKVCGNWFPHTDDFVTGENFEQSRNCSQNYQYKNGSEKLKDNVEFQDSVGTLNPLLKYPLTGFWQIKDTHAAVVQSNSSITSMHKLKTGIIFIRKSYGEYSYLIDLNLIMPLSDAQKVSAIKLNGVYFNKIQATPMNEFTQMQLLSNEFTSFNSIAEGQAFTIEFIP